MSPTELKSVFLAAAQEAFERLQNVAFNANQPTSRSACAEQAAKIRARSEWGLADPRRRNFYESEANADPQRVKEFLLRGMGYDAATLAKLEGSKELGPVWKYLDLVDGDPALELVKLKESVSSILQEAQNLQEKAEKEVREMRAQVESATRQVAELETLMETTQARAAEAVSAKEALLKEKDREIQSQAAAIAKLRAELQTAQTSAKAPAPVVAQQVPSVDNAELERLKKLTADQAAMIERYKQAKATCVDDELVEAVEFVVDKFDEPAHKQAVKYAVYFIRTTLDGRT